MIELMFQLFGRPMATERTLAQRLLCMNTMFCNDVPLSRILCLCAVMMGTTAAPALASPIGPDNKEKSSELAVGLSAGATVLGGIALSQAVGIDGNNPLLTSVGFAGLLVGPSLGHFYTADWGRELILGIGGRIVGIGLFVKGLSESFTCLGDEGDEECDNSNNGAAWALLGGVGIYVASTLYSIVDASLSAQRFNRRSRRRLTLMPGPVVGPDRSTGLGLTLQMRF